MDDSYDECEKKKERKCQGGKTHNIYNYDR